MSNHISLGKLEEIYSAVKSLYVEQWRLPDELYETVNFSMADFVKVANIVAAQRETPKILEIGTFIGVSATCLALAFPETRITTIDPNFPLRAFSKACKSNTVTPESLHNSCLSYARNSAKHFGLEERISFMEGFWGAPSYSYVTKEEFADWSRFNPSAKALTVSPSDLKFSAPFDVVFIDGDHSESAVMSDVANALQVMNLRTGSIVFDDCYVEGEIGIAVLNGLGKALQMFGRSLTDQVNGLDGQDFYKLRIEGGIGHLALQLHHDDIRTQIKLPPNLSGMPVAD